jgi:hypothetical protein
MLLVMWNNAYDVAWMFHLEYSYYKYHVAELSEYYCLSKVDIQARNVDSDK